MHLRPSRFLDGCALGAVLWGVLPAAAQQSILFSKPTETAAEKANSFMLEAPSKLQGRAGEFNAPKQLFNFSPEPTPPLPVMPNIPSQSLRDALDKRKNWTLLTPEEILGVPTPEKILGLPAPNNEDNLSPEQRFLSRQDRAVATAATNAQVRSDAALLENEANPFLPNNRSGQASRLGDGPDFHSTPNANLRPDGQTGADQRDISPWTSAFTVPPAAPKPSPEQQAAMERFRALMEPSSPVETTPARPVTSTTPLPDPNLQPQPLVNPLGHSFTPLQSSIGRPTGIMPLPGITGPYKTPAPSKSSSQAQLPPWLSDSPPPFGASPRKF